MREALERHVRVVEKDIGSMSERGTREALERRVCNISNLTEPPKFWNTKHRKVRLATETRKVRPACSSFWCKPRKIWGEPGELGTTERVGPQGCIKSCDAMELFKDKGEKCRKINMGTKGHLLLNLLLVSRRICDTGYTVHCQIRYRGSTLC